MKYGLSHLRKDFPNDQKCLQFAFDTLHSKECSCGGRNTLMSDRPQYYCTRCRKQTAVLSGTIFERSLVPLRDWFRAAILLKQGCSVWVLAQKLGVGYKTAWRVRKLLDSVRVSDTITICRIERSTGDNIASKTGKNSMPIIVRGTEKTKKRGDATTKNTAKTTSKHTDSATGKRQRTFVLKLFLGTEEQYQNALAVEKQKTNFWHLTTSTAGKVSSTNIGVRLGIAS